MTPRAGHAAPLYVRMLRLKHLRPGGLMCFLLFEGVVAFAVLLSLAELVNWWSVLVLPLTVAGLVKVNDVVSGAFTRAGCNQALYHPQAAGFGRGTAPVPVPRKRRDPQLDAPTELDPAHDPQARDESATLCAHEGGSAGGSQEERLVAARTSRHDETRSTANGG